MTENPWGLQRPKLASRRLTLTDPRQPDFSAEVTLQEIDVITSSVIASEVDELTAEHVGTAEKPGNRYPTPDGSAVTLNEHLIRMLCTLNASEPAESRHGFGWWLGLALHCPNAYAQAIRAGDELNSQRGRDPDEGNPPGAASTTAP